MSSFVAILATAIGVTTATEQPMWHTDYGEALQQTRSDERPLLMVIDNPSQEDERLDEELLRSAEPLGAYDLCRVDASTGYGKKVAQAFKTDEFPYVAVIDKSGSVILHSHCGPLTSNRWTGLLSRFSKGERPIRHVVAKAVSTATSVTNRSYDQYMGQHSTRPYCAKCQRGY